jgi:phage FluMu protein Com
MFMSLAATVSTIHHLARTCPRCKRAQVVALTQRYAEVGCKHCHARIPPVTTHPRHR